MTDILLIVTVVLLVATVALLLMLLRKVSQADTATLVSRLDAFEKAQERTERAVREEVAQSRDEQGNGKCNGTSYNPSVKHKVCVFNKLIKSIR